MKWQPLLPSRKPQAGTDQVLDQMFERALSAREFARTHGWPLPQSERFKWRRCLLVILGPCWLRCCSGSSLNASGSLAPNRRHRLSKTSSRTTKLPILDRTAKAVGFFPFLVTH